MSKIDDLIIELQTLRDCLDDADTTPLGQVEKLLDKMAVHCDRAAGIARRLGTYQHD